MSNAETYLRYLVKEIHQSTDPTNQKTYDNEEWVMVAMEAQGFVKDADGIFQQIHEEMIEEEIVRQRIANGEYEEVVK